MLEDDEDYDEEDDDGCNNHNDDNNNDATSITVVDFFDHEPSIREKMEMRKATKPPSEWLNLLCREWANENQVLVETTDAKFLDYKPYLKGLLSSQLLCRLSIPAQTNPLPETKTAPVEEEKSSTPNTITNDFWEILGITDSFDRSYIVAQIERFCSFYSIRAISLEDMSEQMFANDEPDVIAANMTVSPSTAAAVVGNAIGSLPTFMHQSLVNTSSATSDTGKITKCQSIVLHKAAPATATSEHPTVECEHQQNYRREQRRISIVKKEQKLREKEENAARKAADRAVREAEREQRRRRKLEVREQREKFVQEQKEAALKRAAELVTSNRVPIEITRGVAAAKAAHLAIQAGTLGQPPMIFTPPPETKKRSAVMVSTANDLHQIVIHSKNLWAKYNAIAREHNQKVCWGTVARELGIHVKVREKYARMHARAEERGFDWLNNGHWKIKDHPEIFSDPTQNERKAKVPPPLPDRSHTVVMSHDDAIAAAAAIVVDASVTFQGTSNVDTPRSQMPSNAPRLVTDPISYNSDNEDSALVESI